MTETETPESIDTPSYVEVLRVRGIDAPPAVTLREELSAFRRRHASDEDPLAGVWRQRADRQASQWSGVTMPKYQTALPAKPAEIDEDAIDALVRNAWAGREREIIEQHIELEMRIKSLVESL